MTDLAQPASGNAPSPDLSRSAVARGDAGSPILEAAHLCKLFPVHSLNPLGPKEAVHAVEDASLALYPGRATALVGESGSGKTTVARMLDQL
jgi:peptide/nickel transport system ATP-binding protein